MPILNLDALAFSAKQKSPKKTKMNENYLNEIISEHPLKEDIDKNIATFMGVPVEIDNTIADVEIIY